MVPRLIISIMIGLIALLIPMEKLLDHGLKRQVEIVPDLIQKEENKLKELYLSVSITEYNFKYLTNTT